jgi:leucyl-tRNA synthetase
VQINGKFRTTIEVPADSLQDAVEEEALKNEQVVKWILVQKINKIIFIKNRIINFVIASQ